MNLSPEALLAVLMLVFSAPCVPGLPPGPGRPLPNFTLPGLHAVPDLVDGGRIVDAHGREVLLRGVNVNAFVEYWAYDEGLFTTYPFTEQDADGIAAQGWTVVRLALSWSRIEPEPGVYDEAHLDAVEAAVQLLESRGVYTLLDLHQDAWGAHLAASPEAECGESEPAVGWDGAPLWATFDDDQLRCAPGGVRELSPAVQAAFAAFWEDRPGPGGIGIRTRYVAMLAHLAQRLAPLDAVAGYDLMNEPNVLFDPDQDAALSEFYGDALAAIRAAEESVGAPARIVFFEPSITWADFESGEPLPFDHDDQIAYAPHIYQGGINGVSLSERLFRRTVREARSFGGAPVLSGEWGSDPRRAADPGDDYFERHLALQDAFRFGSTLWTWREACGDPHKAGDARAGRVPFVWGLFDVDCATNEVLGTRDALASVMRRGALRAAPGPISAVSWQPEARVLDASGEAARAQQSFIAFVPAERAEDIAVETEGIDRVYALVPARGGFFVTGRAEGGPWMLHVEVAPAEE